MLSITSPVTFYIFVSQTALRSDLQTKTWKLLFFVSVFKWHNLLYYQYEMPSSVNSTVGFEVSQFTQNTNYWHCD